MSRERMEKTRGVGKEKAREQRVCNAEDKVFWLWRLGIYYEKL